VNSISGGIEMGTVVDGCFILHGIEMGTIVDGCFIGKLDIFSLISLSDIVSITHSDSDTGKYC
jgi:hypothetical protein